MNGGFGAAAFGDFGDAFGPYGGTDGSQDQHQHNPYNPNAAQFDTYDPLVVNNPSFSVQLPYNSQYNSTGRTHTTFLPGGMAGVGLGTDPLSSAQHLIQQHHQHLTQPSAAQQFAFHNIDPAIGSALTQQSDNNKQHLTTSMTVTSHSPVNRSPYHPPPPTTTNSRRATNRQAPRRSPKQPPPTETWLEQLSVKCPDVSLDPLTGLQVLQRVQNKTRNVVSLYLPCVEFLVACQQDLRTGLAEATKKRIVRHCYRDALSPSEFYDRYLSPLPTKFYQRNKRTMDAEALTKAVTEIEKLCADSKRVEYQGCEVMKNTFLGGMKDGESWGLRKWLSKHGGALHICNDLECILRSCQDMDRSLGTTKKLSDRLTPLAKNSLDRLKREVPASYQEISTAHPYLPFFHRLESALRGMSNFDPEDDDVICIDDDDEIEEVKQVAASKKAAAKRKEAPRKSSSPAQKKRRRSPTRTLADDLKQAPAVAGFVDNDDNSVIEIIDASPHSTATDYDHPSPHDFVVGPQNGDWECPRCTMLNEAGITRCCMCDKTVDGRSADSDDDTSFRGFSDFPNFDDTSVTGLLNSSQTPDRNSPVLLGGTTIAMHAGRQGGMDVISMADAIEELAKSASRNHHIALRPAGLSDAQQSFWDEGLQYSAALRIFGSLLRNSDSVNLISPIDESQLLMLGMPSYSEKLKHPLFFEDIVYALVDGQGGAGNGVLPPATLSSWNMWHGFDLLQAIDLVFLNHLAYNGKEKTRDRSQTNKLRRELWEGINVIVDRNMLGQGADTKKSFMPTRRGESSGFVVLKSSPF